MFPRSKPPSVHPISVSIFEHQIAGKSPRRSEQALRQAKGPGRLHILANGRIGPIHLRPASEHSASFRAAASRKTMKNPRPTKIAE